MSARCVAVVGTAGTQPSRSAWNGSPASGFRPVGSECRYDSIDPDLDELDEDEDDYDDEEADRRAPIPRLTAVREGRVRRSSPGAR
jgi:hypothetical protein